MMMKDAICGFLYILLALILLAITKMDIAEFIGVSCLTYGYLLINTGKAGE
jgi:hypothetical protein